MRIIGIKMNKKGIMKNCEICNKEFYVSPCLINERKFCSKDCFYLSEKNRKYWGEGLTKETDERIKKISEKKTKNLDEREIIRMYTECKTLKEIAIKFNVSSHTILNRLKKNSIPIRKTIQVKRENFKNKRKELDENKIIDLYCKEDKRIKEISRILNISPGTIKDRLIRNNIELIKKEAWNKGMKGLVPWNKGLTKETDERVKKYIESGKKTRNEHPEIILKTIEKRKLTIKEHPEIQEQNNKKHSQILQENPEIMKRMVETRRKRGNYRQTEESRRLLKERALEQFKNGVPRETLIKRSAKIQGVSVEEWKEFISHNKYPKIFNDQFRLVIRQRDGFMCLKCGMREEDSLILFKRKLHIHHIDSIKENTFPENCCALCIRCNNEVKKDREIWKKHFQLLLSKRYGYQYSEDGKIILNLNNGVDFGA